MFIRSDARHVPGKPSATNTQDQPLIWLVFFYRKLAASAEPLELYRKVLEVLGQLLQEAFEYRITGSDWQVHRHRSSDGKVFVRNLEPVILLQPFHPFITLNWRIFKLSPLYILSLN
jgi:hypothetical protein